MGLEDAAGARDCSNAELVEEVVELAHEVGRRVATPAETAKLFGFPRFYWLQLAFILIGVGTTTLVYQMTKRRG